MVRTFPTPDLEPDTIRARACADLYPIAAEHALASSDPVPALRVDAAMKVAAAHGTTMPAVPHGEPTTITAAWRLQHGEPDPDREYTLPLNLQEATTVLLGYATTHAHDHPGYLTVTVQAIRDRLDHATLDAPALPDRRQP